MNDNIILAKINDTIREIFNDELQEFGKFTEKMYNEIDTDTAQTLVASFLVAGVINEKLILKKRDFDYGARKY